MSDQPLYIDATSYTWAVRLEQGDRLEAMKWLAGEIYKNSDYQVAVAIDGVHLMLNGGEYFPAYITRISSPAEWNQWQRDHPSLVYGDILPE